VALTETILLPLQNILHRLCHATIFDMSAIPPKPPARTTGLSPKEQRLQAMREKLAKTNGTATTAKPGHVAGGQAAKVPSGPARKAAFQRKAT
jgi:hypothetical protein